MTSIHPLRDVPSTSRSLPPIPAEALDRGRAKTRINTDPDAYANLRTPSGTISVSLPPIRPSARGSKDEGCGPLPGISAIIDQSELPYEHKPARRLSESSPRGYVSPRDWEIPRVHSPVWSHRQTRVDSISTVGTDGSLSRPSSPDASALSSSTSSLSSIIEDRSSSTSPGPIPRFALGSRLPPLGAPHSAFELSDLRTSLPSDETGTRRSGPSRTPVFRSPRSTPLPLSRPMSPAIQLSPHLRPLTHQLRRLVVTVEDRVMDTRFTDSPPRDEPKSGANTPPASVKSEPETDSAPGSPRSKGLSETDLFPHEEVLARSRISLDTQTPGEQRDEQMACTPTQPDPKLPSPWMDTEPSTPTNRHSPLVCSPSPASSPPAEDEDTKSGIKQSESETEEEEMSYAERRAQRRAANAGKIDTSAVRTRGGSNFDWLMSSASAYPPMPLHATPEIAQLAQHAERLGFKLQADPTRQAAQTQSQMLMQMAERQHHIERLQKEQEQAAANYRLATWNMGSSIDQQFGGMSMPELAPPPLNLMPVAGPQIHPPPITPMAQQSLSPIPQTMSYIPDALSQDLPPMDYSSFASTSGYTDLPTGLADFQSLSPPSLTAASSATSASSPSDSFSWASPPPPSLSAIMPPTTRSTFKAQDVMSAFRAQDTIPEDDFLQSLGASTSVIPTTGSGTHKCQSCGKTFRRPSGLKDHMNIHSGEKPYCCPLETCRKGFATRSNMIRHHNKTHPNRPKIGGVADIGGEAEEVPNVDIVDPTSPDQGSSSQGRFRVVQQSGGKEVIGAGVGPVRGAKERRTMRKQTVSGAPPLVG